MITSASQRPLAIFAPTQRSKLQYARSVFTSAPRLSHKKFSLSIITNAEQNTTSNQSSSPSVAEQSIDQVPTGCSRYSVSLGKPLGLVLEENKSTGTIIVAEIIPGGNAEKSGVISVGDQLIATSGYTRTTEQTYNDITVRGGEQVIRLPVRGETFDTVLAAISSHPGNFQVKLEFQQCEKIV
jgi:C-terminal processing protease CtpA/Prc